MRLAASAAALAALLTAPAFCADLVVTRSTHSDAMKLPGMEQPAKDSTEITWFAKDRMRVENGDQVTIVRADLKKMYMLDVKQKTVSTVDLPIDMKKYVSAEMAPMLDQIGTMMKITVTPTTETKKIKDWNATKYTMTMSMPMGGGFTRDIWATKDIELDSTAFNALAGTMMSSAIGGASMAADFSKIEGFTVLTEGTQKVMGQSSKTREELVSIEKKEAPEGLYEVPKGFTEKPFDPMAGSPMGGGGGAPGGHPGKPAGVPPGGKSN